MNIPNKLIIEGEDWTVDLIENTNHKLGTRKFGESDMTECLITLDANHRTEQTFLHELVHIIGYNHGLDLSESHVLTISQVMYAIIVDNKLNFS